MVISALSFDGRLGTVEDRPALLALTIVAMVGFLALAIDLGMLAIAKTQAQQAADLAALTAARSLNGIASRQLQPDCGHDQRAEILTYNVVLGQPIQSSQLQLTYGSYDYNQTTQTFSANFPATAAQPATAVTATVTSNSLPAAFSKIFGTSVPAQRHGHRPGGPPPARHRPGDGPLRLDALWAPASDSTSTPPRAPPTIPTPSSRRSATIRRAAPA